MTDRMALVPVEASETMIKSGAHTNSEWLNDNAPIGEKRYEAPAQAVFGTMLAASPNAGKVSREMLRAAGLSANTANYISKSSGNPGPWDGEKIAGAVIKALGLEVEE